MNTDDTPISNDMADQQATARPADGEQPREARMPHSRPRCAVALDVPVELTSPEDRSGGTGAGGFELFPGFKRPPNQGTPPRTAPVTHALPIAEEVDDHDDYFDDGEEEPCANCDGWGYTNCYCGGDFCICDYNGEKPCWTCV